MVPTTISQKIFMCFGLTVGSFMTTYFISAIVHLVATQNQTETTRRLFYINLKYVYFLFQPTGYLVFFFLQCIFYVISSVCFFIANRDFMLYYNISKPLQTRIRKYFQFIHANSCLNDNEILNWLSPTLRQDVTIQIRAHLVRNVPFLTHIDKVFLSEVTKMVFSYHCVFDRQTQICAFIGILLYLDHIFVCHKKMH